MILKSAFAAAFAVALLGSSLDVLAAQALSLKFVTHAAFFSAESKQPEVMDPHAFVVDPTKAEAVGPQGIKHAAGYRPARVEADARSTPVYTADGRTLGFDLGAWLGVEIADKDGGFALKATFRGLKPGGAYSLFENHFDQKPVGFTPIDGDGMTNSFTAGADGSTRIALRLTHMPTHANAVLLVYHSDGKAHGLERGQIGVNAHHQLIARPD